MLRFAFVHLFLSVSVVVAVAAKDKPRSGMQLLFSHVLYRNRTNFDPASSAECMNLLFRGSIKQNLALKELLSAHGSRPGAGAFEPTCEMFDVLLPLWTEDFNAAGCSWGYPNEIFEAASRHLAGSFFNEDCDAFEGAGGASVFLFSAIVVFSFFFLTVLE